MSMCGSPDWESGLRVVFNLRRGCISFGVIIIKFSRTATQWRRRPSEASAGYAAPLTPSRT